jgi:predicted dipeptidase
MNEKSLEEEIQNIQKDFHEQLAELIAVPSVLADAKENMPFGEAIDAALKKVLFISKHLGFETFIDPDGYYGYAQVGSGAEMIGVLGHIDVVPAGNLEMWETNPFEAVIKEQKMFGRGTGDDKGPTLAALFAVKALMNLGVAFNKRVRFIFGTDEENLWRCMEKYVQKEEIPTMGFTPDSSFPLVYAEKGLLQVVLEGVNETPLRFEAGAALNAVPDQAIYTGAFQDDLKKALDTREFTYESKEEQLIVLGKAAHAQVAQKGVNAVNRLLIALKDAGHSSKVIDFVAEMVQENPFGELIFGQLEDEASGKLKFNVGKVELNAETEKVMIDLRIPVSVAKETIVEQLTKVASEYGLTYRQHDFLKSIYLPQDSFLVQTLMKAYQEVTGDMISQPISSGGATYARAMENFVAFGASFPGEITTEHQPNEHINLEKMNDTMLIYAKAILALTKK